MTAADDLKKQYSSRFADREKYRDAVWKILTNSFFSSIISPESVVLDLGCGWGEFVNNIKASKKYGMDLNEDSATHLLSNVEFLHQDCSMEWNLPDNVLDVVFTSNFFEHLPSKECLSKTLEQAWRCLKQDGIIICLGPNIKFLHGRYWDFYDHYLPLTELSLSEGLRLRQFDVVQVVDRFLPYTMAVGRPLPLLLLKAYLKTSVAWPLFGKQFLVVGRKIAGPVSSEVGA